jgi:hypothetical protein
VGWHHAGAGRQAPTYLSHPPIGRLPLHASLRALSPSRPTHIGLTNTMLAPSRALAPIIGGWPLGFESLGMSGKEKW